MSFHCRPLHAMLGAAVAILLCSVPSQVNGLITSAATCLPGYDWMFSSISQSPCDVAEELLSVCFGSYPLPPLPVGYTYSGPRQGNGNSCSCSSVVYSLLSACAICQNRTDKWWSGYSTNCTTGQVSVAVFKPQIPDGVRVPAYAYQDVSIPDTFNVTLAQRMRDPDSTRLPSSSTTSYPSSVSSINGGPLTSSISTSSNGGSTSTVTSSNGGTITPTSASASSGSGDRVTVNDTPAIIGGLVGGVVGIGLIVALIIFLVRRPRQKPKHYHSNFQRTPNMEFTSSTTTASTTFPGQVDNAKDHNTYAYADPNIYHPHRQHSDVCLNYSGMPKL